MSRRQFSFDCTGDQLAATLDEGKKSVGLLIVSGGNELRSGAFASQAILAAKIAGKGYPVFRFDRRGVGDSEGINRGYEHSAEDVRSAVEAFRNSVPSLTRVVAFGNCDAASALMLQVGAGCDALILSNPWTFDEDSEDGAMPPEAIRSRYAEKLRNPAEIKRLLTGGVSLAKLWRGLRRASTTENTASGLGQAIRAGLAAFDGEARILIAERDRTAQAFLSHWAKGDPRLRRCPDATHAYVEPPAQEWLLAQILDMLTQEEAR